MPAARGRAPALRLRPAGTAHRAGARGDHPELVRPGREAPGDLEGRQRAGGIQDLEIGEDQEGDAAWHAVPVVGGK